MPDALDLDLAERFEPLAAASFGPATDPRVLRSRAARRRRRRRGRGLVTGGVTAVLAALAAVGVLAALAAPADTGPTDELRTVAPAEAEEPSVPASYGTEPRLVVGIVPWGLSSEGCAPQVGEAGTASCTLGVPATARDDGILITMRPVTSAAATAWANANAHALAAQHGRATASFATVGGRDVLDLGEQQPGAGGGGPGATRSYEVLAGSSVIDLVAEGVTDEQLDEVVRGLGVEPADLGFATSIDALPAGARAIAQGAERLWYQPDPSQPARSHDTGGDVAAITYAVGDDARPLVIHVVREVHAASYLDAWAIQQEETGASVGPVIANGRPGHLARPHRAAPDTTDETLAVAVDDGTVIIVEGAASDHDALIALAGRTRVAPLAPVPD
jgi:hypothetical protein